MKKNLGMFLGLPRRGARAVLPALFTFTAACVLSVSSAQAALLADWINGAAPVLDPGGSVASATPSSSFTDSSSSTAVFNFSVTLNSGWTASTVKENYTFTITGATGNSVVIDSISYGNGAGQGPVSFSLSDIPDAGTSSFSINLTSNPNLATVTFTDVNFSATPVPEPINYALAGFGLIFVGVGAGRYYLGRRRLATAS